MKASEMFYVGIVVVIELFLIWIFTVSLNIAWLFVALFIFVIAFIVALFDMQKLSDLEWQKRFEAYHRAKVGSKWDFTEFDSGKKRR